MATGDLRNNLKKLQKQISLNRYPDELDYEGLTKGDVTAYLPILYYTFFDYSPQVVTNISKMNYNLAGKKDTAFMNVVFKIMREKNPKTSLNLKVAQFMTKGFAERKIILTTDILTFIRTLPRLAAGKPRVRSKSAINVAALIGAESSAVEVSSISAIPSDEMGASQKSYSIPLPSMIAPQMQSTSRSTSKIVHQANSVRHGNHNHHVANLPTMHSTLQAAMGDLQSLGGDEVPLTSTTILHHRPVENLQHDQAHHSRGEPQLEENTEFKTSLLIIQQRQDSLECENGKLRSHLDDLQAENIRMKKKIEALETQEHRVDLANIIARLDVIESKILVIENSTKATNIELHNPVCGYNLCSHLKELQLQQNNSIGDRSQMTSDGDDKSLLDVTNDSLLVHTQQRRMKLLDLVKDTRILLGMSDISDLESAEKANNAGEENEHPE